MIRDFFRSCHALLLDFQDWLIRLTAGQLSLPPRRLRDVGSDSLEDFERTGREFLEYFKEFCALSPGEDVLEIGCGSGRIALALTSWLDHGGSYTGVEIVKPSVEWCAKNISARFPNFHFVHADLYNKRYNPTSTVLAREYSFPFPDSSFDFVYLTSVFTHLLPEDLEHYLSEIRRLMRSDGRTLVTCFLLNATQRDLAKQGKNAIDFFALDSHCRVRDFDVPESAVAYEEEYLLGLFEDQGLSLAQPVRYGTWSGRSNGLSFQDILILSAEK